MRDLVEAVPNFSAATEPDVVGAIVQPFDGRHGHLLDVDSDAIHNRTVVSVAGFGERVAGGLFRAIAAAVERIDIRAHAGVHPRVGVADVVPLVSLDNVDRAGVIALAQGLGEQIWAELRVPVFFYADASKQQPPLTLARIRAGDAGYDVGDSPHPTAGATCVGVRPPLVAYNVVLPGATFAQGRELARLIRESSGGLPGVQALAFDLGNGDMQLSMNLVKLAETSPNRALQQVHSLAAQLGIKVGPDEVVGLCPAAVANHAAKGRILEIRIAASAIGSCLRAAPDDESWLMLDYAAGQLAAAV